MPSRNKQRQTVKKIARITRNKIISLIISLFVIILLLALKAGEPWWPLWIAEHRLRIIGILILAELVLGFSAPVVIEADSNPRALSGPGKNPQMGGDQ